MNKRLRNDNKAFTTNFKSSKKCSIMGGLVSFNPPIYYQLLTHVMHIYVSIYHNTTKKTLVRVIPMMEFKWLSSKTIMVMGYEKLSS